MKTQIPIQFKEDETAILHVGVYDNSYLNGSLRDLYSAVVSRDDEAFLNARNRFNSGLSALKGCMTDDARSVYIDAQSKLVGAITATGLKRYDFREKLLEDARGLLSVLGIVVEDKENAKALV